MLKKLTLSGLALAKNLTLELGTGLNILSGESGAGKSMVIKSLGYLFTGKMPKDLLLHGEERQKITATFIADGEVLELVREFDRDTNKSSILSQGKKITTEILKKWEQSLIMIVAQNESVALLKEEKQAEYLDLFLQNQTPLQVYQKSYQGFKQEWAELELVFHTFMEQAPWQHKYRDFVKRVREISPNQEEYDELRLEVAKQTQRSSLSNEFEKFRQFLNSSTPQMHQTIKDLLRNWQKIDSLINDSTDSASKLTEQLQSMSHSFYEICNDLEDKTQLTGWDPDLFEKQQTRLAAYQKLLRFAQVDSISAVLEKDRLFNGYVNLIDEIEERVHSHLDILETKWDKVIQAYGPLLNERKKAAEILESGMNKGFLEIELHSLIFKVRILPRKSQKLNLSSQILSHLSDAVQKRLVSLWQLYSQATEHGGLHRVSFAIDYGLARDPVPLADSASGGETSRILLALIKLYSEFFPSKVLVFDEVDSGVSSQTALKVGAVLRELSRKTQVVCISHLPQVVAYADHLFHVEKIKNKHGVSESVVNKILEDEKTQSLAKFLSGKKITKASLESASQLLKEIG